MTRAVMLCAFWTGLGCGHTPQPPAGPLAAPAPTAPKISLIHVHGIVRGKAVDFECTTLSSRYLADQSAVLAEEGPVLNCTDPSTRIALVLFLDSLAVGTIAPYGSEHGRVVANLPEKVTTDRSAIGSVTVTAWDPVTRRLVGSASLRVDEDITGQPASLRAEFDVVLAADSTAR